MYILTSLNDSLISNMQTSGSQASLAPNKIQGGVHPDGNPIYVARAYYKVCDLLSILTTLDFLPLSTSCLSGWKA